jgi:cytochrome c oxidase subunit II
MLAQFQFFPDQASTNAAHVDRLLIFLLCVTGFFALLIVTLVITFAVKYRRRAGTGPTPSIKGSMTLETIWTGIPFVLAMIMFGWGVDVYFRLSRPPNDAQEIYVVGKQWMWKIQHGDGQREINELHVPIGKPVKLIMTSQDVIHDFFIPAFRVKMDVIPGRYTTEWFEATKPGEYHLFCSQFCGTLHAAMIGKVVAMDPDKYQAWLAGTVIDETPTAAGEKLFAQFSCISCHSQRAPTMASLFGSDVKVYEDGVLKTVKADEGYIRESIVDPNKKIVQGYQPLMPSFQGQMTEEQIYELIAYIKSLGPTGGRADEYKMINRYPAPPSELTPR